LTTSSNRKKFALMAIGMSKGGDMRDPRDSYQRIEDHDDPKGDKSRA
jgi:hypothetical protein